MSEMISSPRGRVIWSDKYGTTVRHNDGTVEYIDRDSAIVDLDPIEEAFKAFYPLIKWAVILLVFGPITSLLIWSAVRLAK